MARKLPTAVPFKGTKEQEELLRSKLAELKDVDGPLMPALNIAQGIYGYLPREVQIIISQELNISLEHIFGVVTFYSQFALNPKGKYKISICMGTACYVKGSANVLEKTKQYLGIESGECTEDGLFSLDATRCLGCCGLAPVMTVNEDVYGRLTGDEVGEILAKYKN